MHDRQAVADADLTPLFEAWLARWRLLPDGRPFASAFGNGLMPVLAEGRPAMLKISNRDGEREGAKLMEWYAGRGAARVLAREGDALLMERLTGGRSLAAMARTGADDDATRVLCATSGDLHAPRAAAPPASLVPLPVWFSPLLSAPERLGGRFAPAAAIARELLAEPQDIVVLHGDIHHDNVLDAGDRGWLAIDPKGLIGERGFEYANMFRTPDAATALRPARMFRQAEIVAEIAGLSAPRLWRWIIAYAGLGAARSVDDGLAPTMDFAIIDIATSLAPN